jgi:hypothetical protein
MVNGIRRNPAVIKSKKSSQPDDFSDRHALAPRPPTNCYGFVIWAIRGHHKEDHPTRELGLS